MSAASCLCHIVGQQVRPCPADEVKNTGHFTLVALLSFPGLMSHRWTNAQNKQGVDISRRALARALSPVVTGTPLYRYSGKQLRHCGTLGTGDTTTRSPRCLRYPTSVVHQRSIRRRCSATTRRCHQRAAARAVTVARMKGSLDDRLGTVSHAQRKSALLRFVHSTAAGSLGWPTQRTNQNKRFQRFSGGDE